MVLELNKDRLLVMLVLLVNQLVHTYITKLLINGKRVNSQTLKLPSGKVLRGEREKNF